jgi:hypothetical protein
MPRLQSTRSSGAFMIAERKKLEYNPPNNRMTPGTIPNATPEPAKMSELSRLSGVFFEPQKTFEDIARRPTFLVPLIAVIVFSLVFIFLYGQKVGWERTIREQMEGSSRAQQMSADQREQQIAFLAKMSPIFGYAGVIVGSPVIDLIIAGVLLLIAGGLMSAPLKFKQVFAMVCFSGLPFAIWTLLATVLLFVKNPEEYNLKNPLVFNPGAFLDPAATSKFVYSLATSLDLFTLWVIVLMATGLAAAAGKKKLSFGGGLFAVILPWGVYTLGKAALAGMF